MKICFIVDTVFDYGGVARVVTTLCNNLCKKYKVYIICTNLNYKIDESIYNLDIKNITVMYIPISKNLNDKLLKRASKVINKLTHKINGDFHFKLWSNLNFRKHIKAEFIEYINREDIDIVVGVHGYNTLLISSLRNNIKSKLIGWQHNSYQAYFETKKDYYWNMEKIFSQALKNIDTNILLTKDDCKKYDANINEGSISIYNPHNINKNVRSCLNYKQFLAIGRLEKQKGFDLLIKSFSIFNKINPQWKLVIVGEGSEEKLLKDMILDLGASDYIKIESFTNDIEKYYLKSSVFVLSSRWEGFGLVWLEAMNYGLPIVSFKLPICDEILIDKNVGLFCEKENINDLAKKMIEIVEDSERLKYMSNNAISVSKEFYVENIVSIWEKEVLKGYKHREWNEIL